MNSRKYPHVHITGTGDKSSTKSWIVEAKKVLVANVSNRASQLTKLLADLS